jgi:hypothetical protein
MAQCLTVIESSGFSCTRVRELLHVPRVMIGSFSGFGRMEGIVWKGHHAEICQIGILESCIPALGLPNFSNYVSAASAYLGSEERSSLILIGRASVTTCTASGEFPALQFSCKEEAASPHALSKARAFVLPTRSGREVLTFVARIEGMPNFQKSALSSQVIPGTSSQTSSIATISGADIDSLRSLARAISLTAREGDSSAGPATIRGKVIGVDPVTGEEIYVPDLFISGSDQFGLLGSWWSDVFSIYYAYDFARREGETSQQCRERERDPMYAADGAMCTVVVEASAIPVGTVILAGAIWAGTYTRSWRVGMSALGIGTSFGSILVFGIQTACATYRNSAYWQCVAACQ